MVENWIVLQRDRNEFEKNGENKSSITGTQVGTNQLWKNGAGWQKPLAQERKAAGNSCRGHRRGQLVPACADLDKASHGS